MQHMLMGMMGQGVSGAAAAAGSGTGAGAAAAFSSAGGVAPSLATAAQMMNLGSQLQNDDDMMDDDL